jgi:hypothetical protein
MTISPQKAIATARREMGVESGVAAQALRVTRFNGDAEDYYLILFGPTSGTTAVATVGAESDLMHSSANVGGLRPHLSISAEEAENIVQSAHPIEDPSWQVTAVWKPCPASWSPFYPLWQVSSKVRTYYVDQQGKIWTELDSSQHRG